MGERYQMDGGTVVDTDNASASWAEATRWDGHNHISMATGSQWDHQRLHRSRRGRYWIECTSQWQGRGPHAEWLSPQAACRWLLANGHDPEDDGFPDDLRGIVDQISE